MTVSSYSSVYSSLMSPTSNISKDIVSQNDKDSDSLLSFDELDMEEEQFSALDTDSERQVQSALKILMKGRTTLMIAHRLSTVVEANKIYVLQDGKIVESGNHQTLLENKGIYSGLWQAQSTRPTNEAA